MHTYKIAVLSSIVLSIIFSVTIISKVNSDYIQGSVLHSDSTCINEIASWQQNIINCYHENTGKIEAEIKLSK